MDATLLEIQKNLADIATQREKERLEAHETAMKDLAEAKKKEEERQSAAREVQREARERAVKKQNAVKEAEDERLREEANLRRLIEQEDNLKQEEADRVVKMKEDIKRKLDEMEHAEEQAKKQLRDVILQIEPRVDTERIVPNPLDKFLQKTPE